MKIFLDDFRIPEDASKYMYQRIGKLNPIYLENWLVTKDYNQFVELVTNSIQTGEEITHISFDHDLADEHYVPEEYWDDFEKSKQYQDTKKYTEKTGLDCAKWFKNVYREMGLALPIIFVHSMNPVGTENILKEFQV